MGDRDDNDNGGVGSPLGTPWISDFGFSASLRSMSVGGGMAGTLQYNAPELLRSRRKGGALKSSAADVYAYGVLLWQMLVGERPWAGDRDPEIIESVKEGERPELTGGGEWREQMPQPLADLVQECWQQDHEARPSFEVVSSRLQATAELLLASPLSSVRESAREAQPYFMTELLHDMFFLQFSHKTISSIHYLRHMYDLPLSNTCK
jgi:serine/threonine protein kinase